MSYFKCENLQRGGAFKIRGAYNNLAQLAPGVRAGGVLAYSSGNHAQAVALAAKLFGVPATIVMLLPATNTIADGLKPLRTGDLTFEAVRRLSTTWCWCQTPRSWRPLFSS